MCRMQTGPTSDLGRTPPLMDQHGQIEKLADAARAALISGSAASALSTIALAVCGKIEEDSFAGPINGPSQWLWGEGEARTRRCTLRHTVAGYVIHHLASIFWATFYERIFVDRPLRRHGRKSDVSQSPPYEKAPAQIVLEAAATTAFACVVDYRLTPKRFRPGFRKHIGTPSMVVVYGAFAAGLALATLARRRSTRP